MSSGLFGRDRLFILLLLAGAVSLLAPASASAQGLHRLGAAFPAAFFQSCSGTLAAPNPLDIPPQGANVTIGVTFASQSCQWTVNTQNTASWLTVSSPLTNTGNGNLVFAVQPNGTGGPRSTTFVVAGTTFTVNQAGSCAVLFQVPLSVPQPAGTYEITVQIPDGCSWDAVANESWLTIASIARVSGGGTVSINVQANPQLNARTATVRIANQLVHLLQAGSQPNPFSDVIVSGAGANFFGNHILHLRYNGITLGCGNGTVYCPTDSVTEGQMAAFVIRAIQGAKGLPQDDFTDFTPTPFYTDVPSTHIFFKYIQKMRDLGISFGCNSAQTLYCSETQTVTRSQMAAYMIRGLAHLQTTGHVSPAIFSVNSTGRVIPRSVPYFLDIANTHPLFPEIQMMRQLGITTGTCLTTDTCGRTYSPEDPNVRQQMSVFLIRAFRTAMPSIIGQP